MKRTPLKRSAGTQWPIDVTRAIWDRDGGTCVGPLVGIPGVCQGGLQKDHIRASGGLGMKSPSTLENGVLLCVYHHEVKTQNGRTWRPVLVEYVEWMAKVTR